MNANDREIKTPSPRHSLPARQPRGLAQWCGAAVLVAAGVVVVWYAAARVGGWGKPNPEELNVLLITLDTTRAGAIGCYGQALARTPHIDGIAREGTRFARCSTCAALTLPSHTSMMTGTYPFVHGARDNGHSRVAAGNVTLAEALKEQGFTTQAIVAAFVLNHQFGINQGFDEYSDLNVADDPDPIHAERKGDEITAEALEALRALASKRFFLWVHYYDPHYPYVATRSDGSNAFEAYQDEIEFTDTQVGRLMQELDTLGINDNTLVVVVGDHGEALTQHGELFHGDFVYDSTLRVPMIFRCPGLIPANRVIESQVRTIDVAPTILDLVDGPSLERCEGVSLGALLRGKEDTVELPAYGEALTAYRLFGLSPLRSLSRGGWKYIHAPKPELYNLLTDPLEQNNLVAERGELADELREELRTLIAEAPPPPSDEESTITPSPTEVALLESLGYVGSGEPEQDDEGSTELDTFELHGEDPKDHIEAMRANVLGFVALRNDKNYVLAEQLFREVIASLPDAVRPTASLAYAVQKQGRYPEAIELYERALALAPDDPATLKTFAGLYFELEQWEEVVKRLKPVLAENPHDLEALYLMGRALSALKRYDEARAHFELALEAAPRSLRVRRAMGVLYGQQRNFVKAIEWFRKALQIDPTDPKANDDLHRALRWVRQQEATGQDTTSDRPSTNGAPATGTRTDEPD